MLDRLAALRALDVVDMGAVALLLWVVLLWLRQVRARRALLGLATLIGFYGLAHLLGLELTVWMLRGVFAVLVLLVIVVFQEDIRNLFEQLAVWRTGKRSGPAPPDIVDTLVRSVARLSAVRSGALLILAGRTPLDLHLRGGIPLEGRVSEPLLLSLFDKGSPGHDGAILLQANRVARFAAHAPLSENYGALLERGTRHAAALGISERTDALSIVVSEETGNISVTEAGTITPVAGAQELTGILRRFLGEAAPTPTPATGWKSVRGAWVELAIALLLSFLLWLSRADGRIG